MIDYILKRSSRRTTGIYIRNGRVEVRAPLQLPKQDIDRFVSSKERWITKNLATQQSQIKQRDSFQIDYGSNINWRGKPYPIVSRDGTRAGFDGDAFYMPPGLTPQQINALCIQTYRRLAMVHFTNRVAYYSGQMGVTPSAIKINSAKTRWGSCSSNKSINFSWRLAMADDRVIDYVIVHELAHLVEMNHSPRFWAIVEGILPDYDERRTSLNHLHQQLKNEDWG